MAIELNSLSALWYECPSGLRGSPPDGAAEPETSAPYNQKDTQMSKKNLVAVIREHHTLFIVIAVGLLLIELEIFIIAAMKSGNTSVIQVKNAAGDVIYESDGSNLSQFDRYYFEQNFGSLQNYRIGLIKRHVPFPFRAWFVAAFGLPVGGTYNNEEIFEDSWPHADVKRIEGLSRLLAGSVALSHEGLSGGTYHFGQLRGTDTDVSRAEGYEAGVDYLGG